MVRSLTFYRSSIVSTKLRSCGSFKTPARLFLLLYPGHSRSISRTRERSSSRRAFFVHVCLRCRRFGLHFHECRAAIISPPSLPKPLIIRLGEGMHRKARIWQLLDRIILLTGRLRAVLFVCFAGRIFHVYATLGKFCAFSPPTPYRPSVPFKST